MCVVVLPDFCHPDIADDGGGDRSRRRFRTIEVGERMRGGPRRNQGRVGGDLKRRFLARSAGRGLRRRRRCKRRLPGSARFAQFFGAEFRWQGVPAKLRLNAIGPRARHLAPIVDAPGRARRNASHAEIADVRIDHIVARIMRDRANRARRLAGVAADADFGVDQVLPDDHGLGPPSCSIPRRTCQSASGVNSLERNQHSLFAITPDSSRTRPFRPSHRSSARPCRRPRWDAGRSSSARR